MYVPFLITFGFIFLGLALWLIIRKSKGKEEKRKPDQ